MSLRDWLLLSAFALLAPSLAEGRVAARGLEEHGLQLVPPNAAEFSRLVTRAIGKTRLPAVDALLPYSAMLTNTTKKRLVFYSIRWTSTSASGSLQRDDRMYFNLTTLRGGYTVDPGANCLVTFLDALNHPLKPHDQEEFTRKHQQSRVDLSFRQQAELTISLDLAIFADGEVVGPNLSGSLLHARTRLDAARDLNAAFETRAAQRENVTFYISWLRDLIAQPPTALDSSSSRWYRTYQKQLAEELVHVYEQGGDSALRDRLQQCFRHALRLNR